MLPPMGSTPGPEYPKDWERTYANPCKEAAGWKCECCGVVDGSIGTTHNGRRKGKPHLIYLNAAHRDRDKSNPKPHLAALCPTCHGLYDDGSPADRVKVFQMVQETRRRSGRKPW